MTDINKLHRQSSGDLSVYSKSIRIFSKIALLCASEALFYLEIYLSFTKTEIKFQVASSTANAQQSHKGVGANPLGFVRVGSFESPALLLASDGAPEPASGRPPYSPTTADTILHIAFHNGSAILHSRHPGRPKQGPTTQNKPCELGLKARTTCFVPTSNNNPTKVSEMHFDLAASFQEKATFLGSGHQILESIQKNSPISGSAHQILHSIQKNSPFLGSIHHLPFPILIQVSFQGLPTILPPDTTE